MPFRSYSDLHLLVLFQITLNCKLTSWQAKKSHASVEYHINAKVNWIYNTRDLDA